MTKIILEGLGLSLDNSSRIFTWRGNVSWAL